MTTGPMHYRPPAIRDGFDGGDDDGGSIIRGTKIKFTLDFVWQMAGGEKIPPDRQFIVLDLMKVEQKWLPDQKKPVTNILPADAKFRNLEELNAAAPRSEWTEKFGKRQGPWRAAYVVYLLDPKTMADFTFIAPTDSAGASRAVRELRKLTQRARMVRGGNVFPIVTLSDTFMPTQYGGRQRPDFKIVEYRELGPQQAAPAQIEHVKGDAAKTAPSTDEMNDEIGL